VALTEEQESNYFAELERAGPRQVRSDLKHNKISALLVHHASKWLAEQERESEHSNAALLRLMQQNLEATKRIAAAAEQQIAGARHAKKRATIALAMATTSMILTVLGIWLSHYWSTIGR
jgi:hypothetical protein